MFEGKREKMVEMPLFNKEYCQFALVQVLFIEPDFTELLNLFNLIILCYTYQC